MQLNKTIENIKNSKHQFFNIELGKEVWFEVLREGICLTNISFRQLYFYRNNLRIIRQTKVHIEYFIGSGEIKVYPNKKISIRKSISAVLSYKCYFSEC